MSGYKIGDKLYINATPSYATHNLGHTVEVVEYLPQKWITDTQIELSYIARAEGVGYEFIAASQPAPSVGNPKYNREIKPGTFVDVYDVLYAFKVTDPCLQHLIKKALAAGQRGHKDARQDLVDIRDSAQRALDSHDLWETQA